MRKLAIFLILSIVALALGVCVVSMGPPETQEAPVVAGDASDEDTPEPAQAGDEVEVPDERPEEGVPNPLRTEVAAADPLEPLSPPGKHQIRVYGTAVFDDDDSPVSGAVIGFALQPSSELAKTDQDGAYAFNGDRPMLHAFRTLTCYTPGYAVAVEPLPVSAMVAETTEVEISFRLVPGGGLNGKVVLDDTGEGLEGVQVNLSSNGGRSSFGRRESFGLQAKSGPDGQYTFDGLAPGIYSVRADGSEVGYPPTDRAFTEIEVRDATAHTAPDLIVTTGIALPGIVLDPEDNPVPGARLSLETMSGGFLAQDALKGKSSTDGSFTLTGLSSSGAYRLTAEAKGFAPTEIRDIRVNADSAPSPLEVRLGPGTALTGRVTLPDQSPVPDIKVLLSKTPDSVSKFYRQFGDTRTDASGEFAFKHLAPGDYEVSVRTPDYATIEASTAKVKVAAKEKAPDVSLMVEPLPDQFRKKREANFRGVVLAPDRSPVPYADVQVLHGVEGIAGRNLIRTDIEGRFQDQMMTAGPVDVVVKSDQGGATVYGLELGREHTIVVNPRVGISGQVVGPDGRGMSACQVYLIPDLSLGEHDSEYLMNLLTSQPDSDETTTDASGNFLLKPVKAGTYVIEARCPDFSLGTSASFSVADHESRQGIRVRADSGATLRGIVVDSHGEPIAGARVSSRRNLENDMLSAMMRGSGGPYNAPESITDTDGAFVLRGLAPGPYRIDAHRTGYAPAEPVTQTVRAGETVEGLRVVLLDGGCVSGVLDAGWLSHGNQIRLLKENRNYRVHLETDGSFEQCGLPAGEYVATIGGENPPLIMDREASYPLQAMVVLHVRDGEETTLRFPRRQASASLAFNIPSATASMWGICFWPADDRGLIPNANLYQSETLQGVKMMSSGAGTYRIHEIPPGNYTLTLGRGMACDRGDYTEQLSFRAGDHISLEIDLPEQ